MDSSVVTSTTRRTSGQLPGSTALIARSRSGAVAPPSAEVLTGVRGSSGPGTVAAADLAHGHDDRQVLPIVLALGAQTMDVHVDEEGERAEDVTPHVAQQHVSGEHVQRLAGQLGEQVQLERGEGDQ